MRALQIERFGAPSEVLKLVEVADTPPGPDEIRVRVEAAAWGRIARHEEAVAGAEGGGHFVQVCFWGLIACSMRFGN
jgi:hypothetical protein